MACQRARVAGIRNVPDVRSSPDPPRVGVGECVLVARARGDQQDRDANPADDVGERRRFGAPGEQLVARSPSHVTAVGSGAHGPADHGHRAGHLAAQEAAAPATSAAPASRRRWATVSRRLPCDPCASTTPAPLRPGAGHPESRTPSLVREVTSRAPGSPSVRASGTPPRGAFTASPALSSGSA
jgi:hypothetical protein